jgi:hypothetical protein
VSRDPLADLLAKQAITEQIYVYCRSLDRMDRALADTVWHPGAHADYGTYYTGDAVGFLDFVWDFHARLYRHSHQATNVLIEVTGVDRAVSESYHIVSLQWPPQDGVVREQIDRNRYLDRWSRRDGGWRLDARRCIVDVSRTFTCAAPAADEDPARAFDSRRDDSDPSYGYLGSGQLAP